MLMRFEERRMLLDVTSDVSIQMFSESNLGKIISSSSRKEISKANKRQTETTLLGAP